MNRRGFLGSAIALLAAPAIVRADSLMRILPAETLVLRDGLLIDAAFARSVRELVVWDIARDAWVHRLDIIGKSAENRMNWQQLGVDFVMADGEDSSRGRAPAMEVLLAHARSVQLKPIPFPLDGRFPPVR